MGKTRVELFVSYARANSNLAGKFLAKYREQARASRRYDYIFWLDESILIGEKWNEAIEQAIKRCDMGLVLVSVALLGSSYISEHELPHFVGNTRKPLIPILLQSVDFGRMDLKGLEERQIFRLEGERFRCPKSYGECTGNQRDRFVQTLFRSVELRIDELFAGKGG